MKLQKSIIAIFALFIFAFGASGSVNAQFGGFIKKAANGINKAKEKADKTTEQINQIINAGGNNNSQTRQSKTRNNDDNWVTFSKIQAGSTERSNATIKSFGCGDSIYATANFAEAVDVSDGFTVSILVDGDVVRQEKMNGGAATEVTETIHIELVPDDNAQVRYPTATILYAETLLKKLSAGKHAIQLAVSIGGDDDIIAVGEFQFNNGAGCPARFERAKRKLNRDIAKLKETQREQNRQTVEETEETETESETTQTEQRPTQTARNVEVELINTCSETRDFYLKTPDGNLIVVTRPAGYSQGELRTVPVGTEVYLKAVEGMDKTLLGTIGTISRQTIKSCN